MAPYAISTLYTNILCLHLHTMMCLSLYFEHSNVPIFLFMNTLIRTILCSNFLTVSHKSWSPFFRQWPHQTTCVFLKSDFFKKKIKNESFCVFWALKFLLEYFRAMGLPRLKLANILSGPIRQWAPTSVQKCKKCKAFISIHKIS